MDFDSLAAPTQLEDGAEGASAFTAAILVATGGVAGGFFFLWKVGGLSRRGSCSSSESKHSSLEDMALIL